MGYLAFIIFGIKQRTKDYGAAYPGHCGRCRNDTYLHPFKWRSWFHLFWVPLIPWTAHRELACPICGQRHELSRNSFKQAKQLASLRQDVADGTASESEYMAKLNAFEKRVDFIEDAADVSEPVEKAETSLEDTIE